MKEIGVLNQKSFNSTYQNEVKEIDQGIVMVIQNVLQSIQNI